MKPLPAPDVLGKNELGGCDDEVRQVLILSKQELRREARAQLKRQPSFGNWLCR